ncbi:hypothetical protein [Leuconostoc mesenteroides]|nr:hypothetical protein [Leuconostoc mesenteroides]
MVKVNVVFLVGILLIVAASGETIYQLIKVAGLKSGCFLLIKNVCMVS